MKIARWLLGVLMLQSICCVPGMAATVSMPDPVLEAAVEALIGDNGMPGTVESTTLATLTQLGFAGTVPNLFGVTDLTGLEYASALEDFVLVNSPVTNWTPIINLPNLKGLVLLDCAVNDSDISVLGSGSAAGQLQTVVLSSVGFISNINTVTQAGLATIGGGSFWNLGELALDRLGQSYDLSAISTLPIGLWSRVGLSLGVRGNSVTGLNVISGFTMARQIDLSETGISETELGTIDFSVLEDLKYLNLSGNFIQEIIPLLSLVGHAQNTQIFLDDNPLSKSAVCVDVPVLLANGFTVSLENVDPCGPEVTLDMEGLGTISRMPGVYRFAPGSSVSFSASPSPGSGYVFTGWTWAGTRTGSSPDFSVVFDLGDESDIFTLVAHFSNTEPGTRTLTTAINPMSSGTGTIVWNPGSYLVLPGQVFPLQATPDVGSYFAGWTIDVTGGNSSVQYAPVWSMPMPDADVSVTARFVDQGAMLSLATVGAGTLSLPPGDYPLTTTAELTVTAYPATGWSFQAWEDTLTSDVISTDVDVNVVMTTDVLLTAVFVPNYTLTLAREGGTNGLTTPASAESPGVTYNQFAVGSPVTVSAVPRTQDWVFQQWTGDLPEGVDPTSPQLIVPMDRDRTLVAHFAPAEYRLSLSAQGEEMIVGSVSPGVGTYGYLFGETVTLSAFPPVSEGVAFIGWRDNATSEILSTALTLSFIIAENRDITAVFASDPGAKSLIIQTSGSGTGQTVPAPGVYALLPGQVPHIEAIPDAGMYFGGWTVETDFGSGFQEVYTQIARVFPDPVMPPYPTRLTARFEPTGYNLSILLPDGVGTVSPPVGSYELAVNTPVTLVATPAEGWNFSRWVDGSGNTVSTVNPLNITLTADREIRPVFAQPSFTLTLIRSGNGTTSPPSSPSPGTQHVYLAGSYAYITATPDAGQMFDGWTGDVPEGILPRQTAIYVPMDRDRTITAHFAPAEVTLTIQLAGTSNPVNLSPPPGEYGFRTGDTVTISALPADGSPAAFVAWTGSQISGEYILTFPINQNMTMIANYTDDTAQSQQLTVLPPEGPGAGHTFPLDTGVYRIITNSTIRFSANPDTGSYFNGWRGDLAGETRPREVPVTVNQPKTIGAAFTLTGTEITLAVQGQGYTIPYNGSYALATGYPLHLFAGRINGSWVFDSWRDQDATVVSSTPEFTYTVGSTPTTLTAVFVEDVTAPTITACAPPTVVYPDENCRWFLEDYRSLVTAVDDYGPISVVQSPPPGTEITAIQSVVITVKDQSIASPDATCEFTVTPVPCQVPPPDYGVDQNGDHVIDVTELMRVIQFYNSGGYHCAADPESTEDGFVPGPDPGSQSCAPSGADLDSDFVISLEELLRVIQFYNAGHYFYCGDFSPDGDGFCPGWPARARLAHAAPGLGFVDLCVTSGTLASKVAVGMNLGDVSAFADVPTGNLSVKVVPVAMDCSTSAIASLAISLATTPVTFVTTAQPLLLAFPEDLTVPPAGSGKVRVIHANWGLQPVTIVSVNTATLEETTLASNLAYGNGSAYVNLPVATYELRVYDAATSDLLFSGLNIQVDEAGIYSVVAGGVGTFNFLPVLVSD
ncbi:MAG: DUF4397 domain-containing protein [Candidatus Hydrogenedentes bacterium]|nr:DUF4397 domain-containing protein [Candidatus Hydrogenedentota bacterium]